MNSSDLIREERKERIEVMKEAIKSNLSLIRFMNWAFYISIIIGSCTLIVQGYISYLLISGKLEILKSFLN